MSTPRFEHYESGDKKEVILSIYDRGADPEKVKVTFESRKLVYENGDIKLELDNLKGEIQPKASSYRVGKVKVEVKLVKAAPIQWKTLQADDSKPDVPPAAPIQEAATADKEGDDQAKKAEKRKNWDKITTDILSKEKPKSTTEDPNAGGDNAANEFFQQLFAGADDDTKKAMMKSYQESNGTTLSTNWDEVKKGKVETKPPTGQEAKKW